jgi:hypothetical protein
MVIPELLGLQNQIRVLHWQTSSYAEHKALGKCYEALDPLVDQFVETYFGIHGRHTAVAAEESTRAPLEIQDYGDISPAEVIDDGIAYLTKEIEQYLEDTDTDLTNIRDEMLGVLKRTRYLLSLK